MQECKTNIIKKLYKILIPTKKGQINFLNINNTHNNLIK